MARWRSSRVRRIVRCGGVPGSSAPTRIAGLSDDPPKILSGGINTGLTMRRWAWRVALALMALIVMLAVPVSVSAFNRACDGSLEGLRYLARVRAELAAATAPPPTPVLSPTPLPTATAPLPTPTPPPTATHPPVVGATAQATASATLTPTPTPVPPAPTSTPSATPAPQPPVPTGPTIAQRILQLVGVAGDYALATVVRVKQTDAIAYPGHIVLAHALDTAGCGQDAVRIQWLKAGLHASRDGQPEQVASALEAHTTTLDEQAELRRLVRLWAESAPRNVPMYQVLLLVEARG
jgi:hypothetical protein